MYLNELLKTKFTEDWDGDYNSSIGRFIGEDPIKFLSQDYNISRYVGNNPSNLIDPSGLFTGGIDFGPETDPSDCQKDLIEKGENNIEEILRREEQAAITQATLYDCSGSRNISGITGVSCEKDKRLKEYAEDIKKAREDYQKYLKNVRLSCEPGSTNCSFYTWKEYLSDKGLSSAP